jgi:hypothetical protein
MSGQLKKASSQPILTLCQAQREGLISTEIKINKRGTHVLLSTERGLIMVVKDSQ